MSQRVSSSSSSAAAAANASSRERTKAQVLGNQAGKRKRAAPSSSSSSAALNPPSEPAVKRSRAASSKDNASTAKRKKILPSDNEAAAAASASTSRASKSPVKKASSKEPAAKVRKAKAATKPMEVENCGICFEESYVNAAVLDCCKHAYCFECIVKWSESSNTCPQCKRRIKRIAKMETATGKRITTKYIKKRDLNSMSQGINPGMFQFGPGFSLNHDGHMVLQHGMVTADINPILMHLFFSGLGENYSDDEDDDDYYGEGDDLGMIGDTDTVCSWCDNVFDTVYSDACPECGHDHDDDADSDEDEYYFGSHGIQDVSVDDDEDDDDAEPDLRGTRENPIELD